MFSCVVGKPESFPFIALVPYPFFKAFEDLLDRSREDVACNSGDNSDERRPPLKRGILMACDSHDANVINLQWCSSY